MILDPSTAHFVHSAFEAAGMAAGARYYNRIRKQSKGVDLLSGSNYTVLVGCLLGAAIGNKLAFWIEMPHLWPAYGGVVAFFLGGQSMVGGLLGGLAGVEIAKRLAGVQSSTGDAFVFPILLGLAIGRVGCFLAGLNDGTFGIGTSLPWGIDFGDGVPRHPTQLYEIIFVAILWSGLSFFRASLLATSGLSFKLMLSAYLFWRLLIDFIKPHEFIYPLGLSGIQWLCAACLTFYLPVTVLACRRNCATWKEGWL
jgi:prolipoprotein diacylglyceryltransferase